MLHQDDRGLALGIVVFVALIVACGLLFILLNPAVGAISDETGSQTNNPLVQQQIDLANQIWGLILFFVMFLGLLGLIVRAAVESRGPR